ncbi:MAG: hypothetical protein ACLGH8_05170 [Bacteroidia bacterium]
MKKMYLAITMALFATGISAQESGNVNYGNNRYRPQTQQMTIIAGDNSNILSFSIRGIYNEKPSLFSATFSIVQVGTSLEEVDALVNEKVKNIRTALQAVDPTIEVITDIISFVPVYEFEATKKRFNKKTYTEKPVGFELKKNLIIKYKGRVLDKIISACATEEVYDFVKVDYVLTNIDTIMQKLQAKTLEVFMSKLKFYGQLKGEDLSAKKRTFSESFNVMYPVESYTSYSAFARHQLPFAKNSVVNEIQKADTQYYNPVMFKGHSYVINPELTEPSVQLFYDVTVAVDLTKPDPQPLQQPASPVKDPQPVVEKRIYMVTQAGDIKQLNF